MSIADGLEHLEEYRALRRSLEENVLPLASSVDGRNFEFQAPLHGLDLPPGGYAMLEHGAEHRLGQVLSARLEHMDAAEVGWEAKGGGPGIRSRLVLRAARGEGKVLSGDGAPFHDAVVRTATPAEVDAWMGDAPSGRARLPVGELRFAPGVPFALDAGGFGRHTFFCGQSGSGKTYSLGVVLEQILLETGLRVVILDPNSDFARLASVRAGVEEPTSARWRALADSIDVRSGTAGVGRVHLRFDQIGREAQAALLQLDPIADRDEYAELDALLDEERPGSLEEVVSTEREQARALALRARNLGVGKWHVWSRGDEGSVIDALTDPGIRCLDIDLGSLGSRSEQALVAGAVLRTFWERRTDRTPVLIVIDEAHNVCPAEPPDELTALATEHTIRIAAEGRKFGLYLLVCTQRPQKVPENVISQCDNLVLMRMSSPADLDYTGSILGFAPPDLLSGATSFRLGEALVAGKLSSHPALIRFGARVAEEGGADVAAGWASGSSTA
jgi:DNA helicase HerA-like ATPase